MPAAWRTGLPKAQGGMPALIWNGGDRRHSPAARRTGAAAARSHQKRLL
jgi:hypothetical protein